MFNIRNMIQVKKVFVGVRIPADVLSGIEKAVSSDPESSISSFIRRAVRRELSEKYLDKQKVVAIVKGGK
jgi:Arc/MetJ-type ribon-helix-helix transcriptional regulator